MKCGTVHFNIVEVLMPRLKGKGLVASWRDLRLTQRVCCGADGVFASLTHCCHAYVPESARACSDDSRACSYYSGNSLYRYCNSSFDTLAGQLWLFNFD